MIGGEGLQPAAVLYCTIRQLRVQLFIQCGCPSAGVPTGPVAPGLFSNCRTWVRAAGRDSVTSVTVGFKVATHPQILMQRHIFRCQWKFIPPSVYPGVQSLRLLIMPIFIRDVSIIAFNIERHASLVVHAHA